MKKSNYFEKFDTEKYRNEIQDSFSGADGWSDFTDPSLSATGDPSMSADGYNDAAGESHLANAPEYSFTISTTATVNNTVTLFGAAINLNPTVTNFGSSSTVTITPFNNVGYYQMLQDSLTEPFTVGRMRVQCALNSSQVTQSILITSTNSQGQIYTDPIPMVSNISEYQYTQTIGTSNREYNITKDVYIQFTLLAQSTPSNATTILTLYLKRKVNTARGLQGGGVTANNYGRPHGGIRPVMTGGGGLKTIGG